MPNAARFDGRAADYSAGRPTYPPAVLDVLRDRIGLTNDWYVLDVGAGTGISSELFLAAGHRVTAVEPNDAMRAEADARLGANPNYRTIAAPAECVPLPGGSADLIVAAQAFHWFDPVAFAVECRRLLSPRGRVLLMWNTLDPAATPAATAYQAVVDRHAIDLTRVQSKWRAAESNAMQWFDPATFMRVDLPHALPYSAETLFARMASSSYMPPRGHPAFETMRADLRSVFNAHAAGGVFTLPYTCELYFGVPRGPAGAVPPTAESC